MPQQPGWLTAPTPLERCPAMTKGRDERNPDSFHGFVSRESSCKCRKRCCIAASPVPNGNGHTVSRGSRDVWGVGRLLQDGASSRLHEPRHRDDDVLRDEQTRTSSQKARASECKSLLMCMIGKLEARWDYDFLPLGTYLG